MVRLQGKVRGFFFNFLFIYKTIAYIVYNTNIVLTFTRTLTLTLNLYITT